jgi:3'-phosphoadenosine 5'-phosphosulfate sulfotransferase (PAPS reductase)/FAD synthetase
MIINQEIQTLIGRGALFVVNHSGGKDSQAMLIALREVIPSRQLLVIHADLPEVDWSGIREHIEATASDLPIIVCRATKTFFEMVERRGMFPSPQQRQCTSDLKRGPIEREIRRYLAAHPEFHNLVVNCMGLRSQESSTRARLETFKRSTRNSVAGREWYDWLPIHELTTAQVFASIAAAGQKPHWAYAAGMTRLSCCFCIMGSRADTQTAARINPELYRRYVETERKIGKTFRMPKDGGLETFTGIKAA